MGMARAPKRLCAPMQAGLAKTRLLCFRKREGNALSSAGPIAAQRGFRMRH